MDSTGLLLHHGLVYVPEHLRMDVLQQHHDAPLVGHPGVAKTLELLTRNYWFPGIKSFVKDYINSCFLCQQAKAPRHLRHGELAPSLFPRLLGKDSLAISSPICPFQMATTLFSCSSTE